MKPDCKKITQVVNYLVSKQGGNGVPELKVIKLVWAADRYHLRKYARTVTRDDYVAMKKGPVGSYTKDVVEFETNYGRVTDEDAEYDEKYIKFYQNNGDAFVSAVSEPDVNELSETDIEALDFALANFGEMNTEEIIELTHKYPEWAAHEKELRENSRVSQINMLDFFKNPEDIESDPFAMSDEILEISKEIFEEYA